MNVCSTRLTSFDASNYSHCQGVNFKWCPLSHHSTGSSRYLGFCKVRKKLLMSKMTQPSHPSFPPLPSLAFTPYPSNPTPPPSLPPNHIPPSLALPSLLLKSHPSSLPTPQITLLPSLALPSLPLKSHSSPLLPFPPYPSNHTPPLSCPSLPTPQITLLPSLALSSLPLK